MSIEPIGDYTLHYRSPEVGLKNRWDMWYREDHQVAAINIRGTIGDPVSWLENFYAAMVPATGVLQLSDSSQGGAMAYLARSPEKTTLAGQNVYQVKKSLPGFKKPDYSAGSNYQRAGIPIVLQPDEDYYRRFPDDGNKLFQHHSFDAYFMLATRYYPSSGP